LIPPQRSAHFPVKSQVFLKRELLFVHAFSAFSKCESTRSRSHFKVCNFNRLVHAFPQSTQHRSVFDPPSVEEPPIWVGWLFRPCALNRTG
jgi:hypothetical protein